jgi:hypothetical protein
MHSDSRRWRGAFKVRIFFNLYVFTSWSSLQALKIQSAYGLEVPTEESRGKFRILAPRLLLTRFEVIWVRLAYNASF